MRQPAKSPGVPRSGDTLVVPSLDRLSRSLADLITTVGELRRRDIGFTSLHESLGTTTPGGRLVFHVFAALAEFIRELIVSGTCEGLSPRPGPAAGSVAAPASSRRRSCAPPGTCCPIPTPASPPSRSCSASAPAPSTTTSLTYANCAPPAARELSSLPPEPQRARSSPHWGSGDTVLPAPLRPRWRLHSLGLAGGCPAGQQV
jgi:Resolvase, N terminal domain